MSYPERPLEVISECDDEEGNPTCWAMLVCEDGDKKRHFIWITKYDDKEYVIEDSRGHNLADKEKFYKTLRGAKKTAEAIAYRQEESGFFTD